MLFNCAKGLCVFIYFIFICYLFEIWITFKMKNLKTANNPFPW